MMRQNRKQSSGSSGYESRGVTRRQFVARSFGALMAAPFISVAPRAFGAGKEGTVTFASFGGAYNEALDRNFIKPFEKQSGISVRMAANTSLAGLKSQVAANAVQWDIAELTGTEYELAIKQGIPLEPLDLSVIRTTNIPEYAVKKFGIKYAFFLEVMAWDRKSISQPPKTWAEFFDSKRYSGKRSLYTTLSDSMLLEFALLADGVAMKDLYPLDVDRALRAMGRLKPDQIAWYETNQQVIQQMVSGESKLGMPFTGRVRIANKGGAAIDYSINEGGATGDYLVVPKGAPNAKNAMKLIDFICNDAKAGAGFMNETHYGLTNLAAIKLLDPNVAREVPTNPELDGKIFRKDDVWWMENLDAAVQKFRAWQVSR
ncbi:MAG: ABC transporter substrate-binding protein [Pusillimonas sp.]|nr:MAG: ABC transporter substrate-binding protein [Pusillimonas sp.]